ncbi:MAG: hypothetical protein JW730_10880 [Anaerolineales bacterium]|nr:hypothetical protein [Anaerolineales bacterium]
MKHFSTFTIITALAMIISACGAEPVATVSPADIAGTAQAAAFTMIAETQAAIPTNTPLPPTETPTQIPSPTNTVEALPTLAVLASPTTAPAANTGGDPCATRPLGVDMKGKPTIIRIWNNTKTPIRVSMYLNETALGACGYRSYDIPKNGDVVITDLVYGCYNLWAWNTSGKPNFNSNGYGCVNNPDKWTFEVRTGSIKFTGP